jgi:xanthine dehydrogenase molybdopterin-binding subunit B
MVIAIRKRRRGNQGQAQDQSEVFHGVSVYARQPDGKLTVQVRGASGGVGQKGASAATLAALATGESP